MLVLQETLHVWPKFTHLQSAEPLLYFYGTTNTQGECPIHAVTYNESKKSKIMRTKERRSSDYRLYFTELITTIHPTGLQLSFSDHKYTLCYFFVHSLKFTPNDGIEKLFIRNLICSILF